MRNFVVVVLLVAGCTLLSAPSASASTSAKDAAVQIVSATVDGQNLKDSTQSAPLRLVPGDSVDVAVQVANHGDQAVHIRHVELSGRVLGLVFYNYLANVDFQIAPGATETVRYRLELSGLKRQGVGLMRGEMAVTDADGNTIAATPMVSDIRGSYFSVYGLFGFALLVLTALASIDAALALARHKLSDNRFLRGVRLLMPGIGVGLLLLFTASACRIWVPETPIWLAVAGVTAALFFACGYFSPTPRDEDDDEDDDILDDDMVIGTDALHTETTDRLTPVSADEPTVTIQTMRTAAPDHRAGD
ncbi:hypothetical protein [Mycolicibacterium sp. CBMA 226]|uniref:hypothetical protein n=1 Tax=Mycolicibacterium sp. CBMA 226 TaxID=2606611 RepID=UPI0012DE8908|nr:hypothetical protein [Mycolicibacterium sp. CBMA 226]MUL76611.1 hypothetical protein [Mycolicibacterium sp. CBMA 226]